MTEQEAQAGYDKARGYYEHWLQSKFGSTWRNHYGDYTYNMGACLGRTFYRGMHDAELALAAAKFSDARA